MKFTLQENSSCLPEAPRALVLILEGREGGKKEDLFFGFVFVCSNSSTQCWNLEKHAAAVKLT